jgi:hypothetical protein
VLDAGTAVRRIPGSGVASDSAVHAQWDTTILRGDLRKPLTVPCLDPLTPATPGTAATPPGQLAAPTGTGRLGARYCDF